MALVGAGRMPAEGEDEREEARLIYMWGGYAGDAAVVIGASGTGKFAGRIQERTRLIPALSNSYGWLKKEN